MFSNDILYQNLLFTFLHPHTDLDWLTAYFSCIVINHQFFKHWKTLKTENETLSHIRGKNSSFAMSLCVRAAVCSVSLLSLLRQYSNCPRINNSSHELRVQAAVFWWIFILVSRRNRIEFGHPVGRLGFNLCIDCPKTHWEVDKQSKKSVLCENA